MEFGFGCVLGFVALVVVLLMAVLFLKARRPGPPPPRGAWSCAKCGAKHPDRVHPRPQ